MSTRGGQGQEGVGVQPGSWRARDPGPALATFTAVPSAQKTSPSRVPASHHQCFLDSAPLKQVTSPTTKLPRRSYHPALLLISVFRICLRPPRGRCRAGRQGRRVVLPNSCRVIRADFPSVFRRRGGWGGMPAQPSTDTPSWRAVRGGAQSSRSEGWKEGDVGQPGASHASGELRGVPRLLGTSSTSGICEKGPSCGWGRPTHGVLPENK